MFGKANTSFKLSHLCSVFNHSMPNTWRIIVLKEWGMSTAGLAQYTCLRNLWFTCCGQPLRSSRVRATPGFCWEGFWQSAGCWVSPILKCLNCCFRQHRRSQADLEELWGVRSRVSHDPPAESQPGTQAWQHGRSWAPARRGHEECQVLDWSLLLCHQIGSAPLQSTEKPSKGKKSAVRSHRHGQSMCSLLALLTKPTPKDHQSPLCLKPFFPSRATMMTAVVAVMVHYCMETPVPLNWSCPACR